MDHVTSAKVVEVYPSEDGCVRKVKILKADRERDNQGRMSLSTLYELL